MQLPTFNPRWLKSFETFWVALSTSPSVYELARNFYGLMPVRENCSTSCWMSEHAWTEWKSYSRPRYNYVAWLPESTPYSVFKSTTLGTRSLFASANMQSEMSIQVRKSVQQLSMSKCLTCAALSVELTQTPVSAMRQLSLSDFVFGASRMSGKTSSRSSKSASSNRVWTDELYS